MSRERLPEPMLRLRYSKCAWLCNYNVPKRAYLQLLVLLLLLLLLLPTANNTVIARLSWSSNTKSIVIKGVALPECDLALALKGRCAPVGQQSCQRLDCQKPRHPGPLVHKAQAQAVQRSEVG